MIRKSQQFPAKKRKVVLEWILRASDRSDQRRKLTEKWLEEGQYTDYRYNVETCEDGTKVYLLRPTWLNKGFDFQVNVEAFQSQTRSAKGGTKEMPSHEDVMDDLDKKLKQNRDLGSTLFAAVCDVYDCVEPDEVMQKRPELRKFKTGMPVDKTLRIVKWLFIEQDLTYWLQTGRNMLMSAIERNVFGIDANLRSKASVNVPAKQDSST